MPKRCLVVTLGCKANQYDGQLILEGLRAAGYVPWRRGDRTAALCVINTCAVTASSEAKSRRAVRRAVREHPGATVIVTGCCAVSSPDEFAAIEGVDHVTGNDEKELIPRLAAGRACPGARTISGFEGHTRAFIKIQDGCDAQCSYCIVPFVRGHSRSRGEEEIVREAASLVSNGHAEIVLSGIHLGRYGTDRGDGRALERLIRRIGNAGAGRVRLSSIEPDEISDGLLELMTDGGPLCAHLHIPLQSGDGKVLADMRRGYGPGEYRRLVERLRERLPDISLTTDVMVGFPTESDEAFERTLEMVRMALFSRVHVFPFSPRRGTAAWAMGDQVPARVKRERALEVQRVASEGAAAYRERFVGREVEVLVQGRSGDHGISREYLPVLLKGARARTGDLVKAVVTGVLPDGLEGETFFLSGEPPDDKLLV